VPGTVGFTLLETRLTVRSQCHRKCHPESRARRRTISRIAVANSPHFGFRRTHGPQRLLGIFYRFERRQTQKALAYFWPRFFQRWALHALSNASVAEGRTFRGVGGSFILCVFGSRDLTQPGLCQIAAKFCHDNIFSKETADCLIVEVPGHVKLPFFSCVLTSLNQPMLKLPPQR